MVRQTMMHLVFKNLPVVQLDQLLLELQWEVEVGRLNFLLKNNLVENGAGDVLARLGVFDDKRRAGLHQFDHIVENDIGRCGGVIEATIWIFFNQDVPVRWAFVSAVILFLGFLQLQSPCCFCPTVPPVMAARVARKSVRGKKIIALHKYWLNRI